MQKSLILGVKGPEELEEPDVVCQERIFNSFNFTVFIYFSGRKKCMTIHRKACF